MVSRILCPLVSYKYFIDAYPIHGTLSNVRYLSLKYFLLAVSSGENKVYSELALRPSSCLMIDVFPDKTRKQTCAFSILHARDSGGSDLKIEVDRIQEAISECKKAGKMHQPKNNIA